jgi:hypothetical protein
MRALGRSFSWEHGDQFWQLRDVEDAPKIVGERGQAELAAHLLQAAHQKRTPCPRKIEMSSAVQS